MTQTVHLVFPAQTHNVALARTLAAAMSARADLPIDQLEDVRLAVDEAVSQLIVDAPPGADVSCAFTVRGTDLDIVVSAPSSTGRVPSTATFSWMVLTALVDHVVAEAADVVTLRLKVTRQSTVDM